jgi:hypothetical protein
MQRLLALAILIMSLSAFGQSYLIMENGVVLTTDRQGFIYDFGHFTFPQDIELRGGQFYVEEGGILVTVDANGFLHRKYEELPARPRGRGINYLLSATGELFIIDQSGAVHRHEQEDFKHALNFGGNYFTIRLPTEEGEQTELELVAVTQHGTFERYRASEFGADEIVTFGGSYFMTSRGVLFTFSSEGHLTSHAHERVGIIQKRGGNYFTDSAGVIFSVSAEGALYVPAIPTGFNPRTITRTGANYFLTAEGRLYLVDQEGNVFERQPADQGVRDIRVISL